MVQAVVRRVAVAPEWIRSAGNAIELSRSSAGEGSLQVFNDETGEDVVAEILADDVWRRVFYKAVRPIEVTVVDTDVDGLPLGCIPRVARPDESAEGSLRISLDHCGRFGFKILGRSVESEMDFALSFVIP